MPRPCSAASTASSTISLASPAQRTVAAPGRRDGGARHVGAVDRVAQVREAPAQRPLARLGQQEQRHERLALGGVVDGAHRERETVGVDGALTAEPPGRLPRANGGSCVMTCAPQDGERPCGARPGPPARARGGQASRGARVRGTAVAVHRPSTRTRRAPSMHGRSHRSPTVAPPASSPRRAWVGAVAALVVAGCRGAGGSPERGRGDPAREAVAVVTRCEPPARTESTGVRTRLDVPYATAGGDTLRLDLALPAGAGPHPVVVLLHGGGWEGGHRSAMHDEMRLLAARGYAAATVSYRLTQAPRDVFPAAVRDVRCAVRWLRASAPALGLDGERIGALGFSAGAYLASMLGVAADLAALDVPGAAGACLVPRGRRGGRPPRRQCRRWCPSPARRTCASTGRTHRSRRGSSRTSSARSRATRRRSPRGRRRSST
jgi:hypothetical protein